MARDDGKGEGEKLRRLPPGRHGLSREFVAQNQRQRLVAGSVVAVGDEVEVERLTAADDGTWDGLGTGCIGVLLAAIAFVPARGTTSPVRGGGPTPARPSVSR